MTKEEFSKIVLDTVGKDLFNEGSIETCNDDISTFVWFRRKQHVKVIFNYVKTDVGTYIRVWNILGIGIHENNIIKLLENQDDLPTLKCFYCNVVMSTSLDVKPLIVKGRCTCSNCLKKQSNILRRFVKCIKKIFTES